MSTIQSKANQAIDEAALRIMESWYEWEAEAGQIAQCEQNPAPYEDFMMHQLTTVIRLCVHIVPVRSRERQAWHRGRESLEDRAVNRMHDGRLVKGCSMSDTDDSYKDALAQLSSYLGCGLGDDNTSADSFVERIKFGIDKIISVEVERKTKANRDKFDKCLSALRVILTWAEFEYDEHPRGHALVPDHVAALIRKTLVAMSNVSGAGERTT